MSCAASAPALRAMSRDGITRDPAALAALETSVAAGARAAGRRSPRNARR